MTMRSSCTVGPLLTGLAGLFIPAVLAAQVPQAAADRWTRTAEMFVDRLDRGDFADAAAMIAPGEAADAMSADRLREIWTQLEGQAGRLEGVLGAVRSDQDTLRVVELDARFERSSLVIRVVLTPETDVTGFWLLPPEPPSYEPPSYVDTAAFEEVEVTVGGEPWALPGTLTLPRGASTDDDVPAVVLVHGSGPVDRDATIGPHRPFRDLAWGLASRGIAVLRYDKRTFVYPERMTGSVTVDEEVVDDALAAIDAARSHDRIGPDRVFLLGHSLGGMMAPEIARRDGRVAGAILLAAPARPISDVLVAQLRYLADLAEHGTDVRDDDPSRGDGPEPDETGAPAPSEIGELRRLIDVAERLRDRRVPPDSNVLGAPASYFYDLADRAPVDAARALDTPLLVLQGGRDYQVTMEDFRLWREALDGRGDDVAFEAFPMLNHLFVRGEEMATPAEYVSGPAEHVAVEVVERIARWIDAVTSDR